MTVPSLNVEPRDEHAVATRTSDQVSNPSYPKRVHLLERAELDGALRSCEQRLTAARQELPGSASSANRADLERLLHQMQGACDQVAEAVRRLPLEAGGLYHEDKERFENAMAAFDRTLAPGKRRGPERFDRAFTSGRWVARRGPRPHGGGSRRDATPCLFAISAARIHVSGPRP